VDEYFYTWNQETTAWEKGDLRPITEPVVEAPVVESAPVAETVVEPETVVETPVVETPVVADVTTDAPAEAPVEPVTTQG